MTLLRIRREEFEFEISREEGELLRRVLSLYPLVPPAHHRLSKGGQIPNQEENQHLLDEALSAQRLADKKQVSALLNEPNRFAASAGGFQIAFTRGEMEWLLQVLNDIRIGSWLALGTPSFEEQMRQVKNKKLRHHLMALEIAGAFETLFIQVLNGDLPPQHA